MESLKCIVMGNVYVAQTCAKVSLAKVLLLSVGALSVRAQFETVFAPNHLRILYDRFSECFVTVEENMLISHGYGTSKTSILNASIASSCVENREKPSHEKALVKLCFMVILDLNL